MNEGFFKSACNCLDRPVNTIPEGVFPDYAVSGNAEEIHKGIRDTISGIRLSILAMGIGLANIYNGSAMKQKWTGAIFLSGSVSANLT